jgi:hypothetical protein
MTIDFCDNYSVQDLVLGFIMYCGSCFGKDPGVMVSAEKITLDGPPISERIRE